MARPKKIEAVDRKAKVIGLVAIPYFAVGFTNPELSGRVGVGRTKQEALASARAEYRRRFPFNEYDIEEKFLDTTGEPA